jgi:hypothetical protein
MNRSFRLSLVAVGVLLTTVAGPASAAPFGTLAPPAAVGSDVQLIGAKSHKTPGARVKGYTSRGGYSYSQEDSINTYGDARTKYGSASSYRDPSMDRQTNAGPFDHGFFFDSATGARGGDAPYMN